MEPDPARRTEFGPVALFFPPACEEQAVAFASGPDFGTGGPFLPRDIAGGKRIASRSGTGRVLINNIDWPDAALPLRCIENPVYDHEFGHPELEQFVDMKPVRIAGSMAPT